MLVAELLHEQKYSLQANRKTKEGSSHPDRHAQFEYINAKATEFLNSGQPAISADAKKKEQVGTIKMAAANGGPRVSPNQSGCMISGSRKMLPMEFTIWGRMQVGSALAPIMTRQRSPSRAFGVGGT